GRRRRRGDDGLDGAQPARRARAARDSAARDDSLYRQRSRHAAAPMEAPGPGRECHGMDRHRGVGRHDAAGTVMRERRMATIDKGLARVRGARSAGREGEIAEISEITEIPTRTGGPIATESLPRIKLNPRTLHNHRVLTDEDVPAASAYKMLRTRVLQRMRRNGWTTLAVTGTCPDEGKTLTAINLSISLARDLSTSVILVDLD